MALRGQGTVEFLFGDGSDGNVTVTGTISLTRDMYWKNLTLSGSGVIPTIYTRSFRMNVKERLYAATPSVISNSGSDAATFSGSLAPSQAGTTFAEAVTASLGTVYEKGHFMTWGGSGGAGGTAGTGSFPPYPQMSGSPSQYSGSVRSIFPMLLGYTFGLGGIYPVYGGHGGAAGGATGGYGVGFMYASTGLPYSSTAGICDIIASKVSASVAFATITGIPQSSGKPAGSNGGIYKTTNRGETWTQLSGGYPSLTGSCIIGISYYSLDNNVMFAYGGTPGAGPSFSTAPLLLKSTNGGDTWTSIGGTTFDDPAGTSGISIKKVYSVPSSSVLYLLSQRELGSCTQDGNAKGNLWRSLNSGTTWSIVLSGSDTGSFYDLCVIPVRTGTILLSYTAQGVTGARFIKKSTDAGATWTTKDLGTIGGNNTNVTRFSVSPNGSYILLGNNGTSNQNALFKSTNDGDTWSVCFQATGTLGVISNMHTNDPEIDQTNPLRCYVALYNQSNEFSGTFARSFNSGTDWVVDTGGSITLSGSIRRLGLSSVDPSTIYAIESNFSDVNVAVVRESDSSGSNSVGGDGGGVILLAARDIVASGSLTFDVSGENGGIRDHAAAAAGGGGGGVLMITYSMMTGSVIYNVSGGLPGEGMIPGAVSASAGSTGSVFLFQV